MKYLSLDLETTCLEAATENILQCSVIVEDTTRKDILPENLPHFTFFINLEPIQGSAFALAMNAWILDIISGRKPNNTGYPVFSAFPLLEINEFLDQHFGNKRITVAGKNVAGFDIPFLPKALRKRFMHKVIDPGPMMINWETDSSVPNFEKCKELAGLPKEVAHDAREDAMDVIKILRTFY